LKKDSFIIGVVFGIIFGAPAGITFSLISTILNRTLGLAISLSLLTSFLAFLFAVFIASPATDYIIARIPSPLGIKKHFIFLIFLIFCETASVLVPVFIASLVP